MSPEGAASRGIAARIDVLRREGYSCRCLPGLLWAPRYSGAANTTGTVKSETLPNESREDRRMVASGGGGGGGQRRTGGYGRRALEDANAEEGSWATQDIRECPYTMHPLSELHANVQEHADDLDEEEERERTAGKVKDKLMLLPSCACRALARSLFVWVLS